MSISTLFLQKKTWLTKCACPCRKTKQIQTFKKKTLNEARQTYEKKILNKLHKHIKDRISNNSRKAFQSKQTLSNNDKKQQQTCSKQLPCLSLRLPATEGPHVLKNFLVTWEISYFWKNVRNKQNCSYREFN